MRIFSFIPALAVLVTAVAGATLPVDPVEDNCGFEVGCEVAQQLATKRNFFEHPTRTVRGLTNAALLRRGLPLKNPIMRRGTPVRRTDPSTVPEPEPQPEPEPEPEEITHRGVIRVRRISDGEAIGYVSRSPTDLSQYRPGAQISNALVVSFKTDSTRSGTRLNISPEDPPVAYPGFLGPVQGRESTSSNLAPGSFNYLYLVHTRESAPGSTPDFVGNSYTDVTGLQRTSESAVWTYDDDTKALSLQWVNVDGALPTIETFLQSSVIYFSGDSSAFHSRFPAPITGITFEFVEI